MSMGYVYILSNPSYRDTVKIGSSNDTDRRVSELNTTGVLKDFKIEYRARVQGRLEWEQKVHIQLSKKRVRKNKEFFRISVPDAIAILREVIGNNILDEDVYYSSPEEIQQSKQKRIELQSQRRLDSDLKYEKQKFEAHVVYFCNQLKRGFADTVDTYVDKEIKMLRSTLFGFIKNIEKIRVLQSLKREDFLNLNILIVSLQSYLIANKPFFSRSSISHWELYGGRSEQFIYPPKNQEDQKHSNSFKVNHSAIPLYNPNSYSLFHLTVLDKYFDSCSKKERLPDSWEAINFFMDIFNLQVSNEFRGHPASLLYRDNAAVRRQDKFSIGRRIRKTSPSVAIRSDPPQYNDDGPIYRAKVRDGTGKHVSSSGVVYEGQFQNGVMHGHGTQVFPNGDIYRGQFKEGKRHGLGTIIYNDGSVYEGNFINNSKKLR
jgi:hypothetical protein